MNLRRHYCLISTVFGAVLLLLLAGCRSSPAGHPAAPPTPKLPWTGLLSDARAVWSAEPGIDLLTGPVVVVRAYLESIGLAHTMGDIGYAYPGFQRAVPPDAEQGPPKSARNRWPDLQHPARHPIVGTLGTHILRIDTAGRQVTSLVCDWDYQATFDLGDGKYGSGLDYPYRLGDGVSMTWIAMTAPADTGPTPSLPPQ